MKTTTAYLGRSAAICLAAIAVLVIVPTASAAKIHKTARTQIAYSAQRTPDGGFSVQVTFSSPNPRCLSASRFPINRDGRYHYAGAIVNYGGPHPGPPGTTQYGLNGIANPPLPWLSPASRFGRSPLIWQAVEEPGSAGTRVENHFNPSLFYLYDSTLAAGSAIELIGNAPAFKLKYNSPRGRVKLECAQVAGTPQFFP